MKLPYGFACVVAVAGLLESGCNGGGGGTSSTPPGCAPIATTISANFNGTPIAAGDSIWFNAVAAVKGPPPAGSVVSFVQQHVTFAGTTIALPDTFITYGATGQPTVAYSPSQWDPVIATTENKNVFFGGTLYQTATGLPGGVQPVTWSGQVNLPQGVSLQWKWGAAVYALASPPALGALDVLAADGANGTGDHAGTPEAIKTSVVGGATGGGGSNWTGGYSGTLAVQC